MTPWPNAFSVEGTYVSVVPLTFDHQADLESAAADGELHKLWYTKIPKPDQVKYEIGRRLDLREKGSMMPFAIIDQSNNRAVGMTTYMNIDAINKRVEIGSTWHRKSVQRSPLNTECKLLLLRYAFKYLNCIAVEFRTHFVNHQSRRAIERLGAKLDGVLRSHMILPNGTVRDTAVYSIIPSEWPTIEANLKWMLKKPRD
jgi:RimJ/RimL family protein N-acetyltransferase|tara:strand:- start:618 stop:1217 length:600 start_codon:yes stop_codon:yes gene_type:complete